MATQTQIDELQQLDASIDDLASAGDMTALSAVLADEFVYSHSTGLVQDKQAWLASLPALVSQRRRVASDITVEVHADVAVVYGDLDIVWNDRPTKYNRYVRVFRYSGGAWLAISQRTVPGDDRAPTA